MSDDAFCSLTGARTFIDSNLVQLRAVDAFSIARFLTGEQLTGVAPGLLPDVLHEAVHHWCFNTRVGQSIALAREQLVEASLTDATGARMGRCYMRYVTTTEVMRPIVEGLACFAEFDVAPGEGNLRAVPLGWLVMIARPEQIFGSGQPATTQSQDDVIRETLCDMRVLESTARRKDHLLAQPLDPSRRGGYLTGYLLVKGLQARTAQISQLARDSELWLSFLHAHFFGDAALAAQLLDPVDVKGDLDETFAPGRRFMERLWSLTDAHSTAATLAAFNESFATNPLGDSDAPLGNIRAAIDRWTERWDTHHVRLVEDSNEPAIQKYRLLTSALLANRDWMCVASAPGTLSVKPERRLVFTDEAGVPRVVVQDEGSVDPAELESRTARDGTMPAALEFWVGPIPEGAVLLLVSALGVHAHDGIWTIDQAAVDEFLASVRSNAHLVALTDDLRRTIDELIHKQPWADGSARYIEDHVEEQLHAQAALAVQLYDGGAQALETLWEDGLFGVFESHDVLKAVSAHGLLASVGNEILARRGITLTNDIVFRAYLDGHAKGLMLTTGYLDQLLV
jgi:hypothetical protein